MHPARVIGRVVATSKYETLKGVKLLLLEPTDWEGKPESGYLVAADAVGAGSSEFVFYVKSREAAVTLEGVPPVDASIVGIIDGVFLDPELHSSQKERAN